MNENKDLSLARTLAQRVAELGGRAYFVGGIVRDSLMGIESKDIDLEIYGITPEALLEIVASLGKPVRKGASFGVLGLEHSELDIAMPRTEKRTGDRHTDFEVSVDPFLSLERAMLRRDFTINAMMRDVLTGTLLDVYGGQRDLEQRVIRCVSRQTFGEDALRVFRAAQFAARLDATIEEETLEICREIDVTGLTRERVFEEMNKALLKAEKPSVFFRSLHAMNHLREFFPELERCIGVEQNPKYHPEGDVFEHTMMVVDEAAKLRERAEQPLWFMIAALFHDLGKIVATQVQEDGRVTAYGHEVLGLPTVEKQLRRLTNNVRLIRYVLNMTELHMRPNMMAQSASKKKKTRMMFDLSVCPNDLILLSRADASGKKDAPYNENNEAFLRERLEDYETVMKRPMVTGKDLTNAGLKPDASFAALLQRGRQLHFAGMEKKNALRMLLAEAGASDTTKRSKKP